MREIQCHACGHSWSFDPPLGRGDICDGCRRDVKVCKNCQHFDTHVSNQCRETQADLITEKESSNFCSYFLASTSSHGVRADGNAERSALEALFGGEAQDVPNSAPASLEDELKNFLNKK